MGIRTSVAFGNDIDDLDLRRNADRAVRVGSHPSLDGVAHIAVRRTRQRSRPISLLAQAARSVDLVLSDR